MQENPIEGLMNTTMNSIKDMVDVNTIIGKPIETKNGIIIPLSKVTFGFASGGSEFNSETIDNYNKKEKEESIEYKLPFGGGSGAAVNISPIAFLVVQNESVKLLPIEHSSSVDKLLDYVPDIMEKANNLINKCTKKEEKVKITSIDSKEAGVAETKEMIKLRHKLVYDITQRLESFSLNTVISGFMEYNNIFQYTCNESRKFITLCKL